MKRVALFDRCPTLEEKLPYRALAELPTPVQRLSKLGERLGLDRLYIKRDDLSGALYGGNKPRKLEFTLGDVVRSGAREVLTFGCAGSNHALATTIYARQLGLRSISLLMDQPNAHYVRRNLLAGYYYGAELHLCDVPLESRIRGPAVYLSTAYQVARHGLATGRRPAVIPPGGSSVLGVIGLVNAAFELAKQVEAGEMPEPDLLYVACGTMGTAAGLLLGVRAAGLRTKVLPVQVVGSRSVTSERLADLANRTAAVLHSEDNSFPEFDLRASEVDMQTGYLGDRYGLFTTEGMEAVSRVYELEGIRLEGTYTGKTLAALINDARNCLAKGRTVLFWNTVNSHDLTGVAGRVNYRDLPREFHRYFEEDVQPLDRGMVP